jgi:hypothetical protein
MLAVEEKAGVRATYCVVGALMDDVRSKLETHGHCLAFHSYDHVIEAPQLERCRAVDYRLKGYRPPRSVITQELTDENLCFHNFEWLASSATSLGSDAPELQNRIVKIPILTDDHSIFRGEETFEDWEERIVRHVRQRPFTAVSLHDCYAPLWLPAYEPFLEKLMTLGRLQTLDEISAHTLLAAAV